MDHIIIRHLADMLEMLKKRLDLCHVIAVIMSGIALAAMLIAITGCSPRIVEKIVTQIEYRDREVHDTTTFEIPVIVEKNVTRDTVSHLENPYGKSDAVVSEGLLHHSLETKPQIIKVPFTVTVTDTLWKESEIHEVIKEVEKPLSWWRKFEIGAVWAILGAFVTAAFFVIKKLIP